jgi:hypothetical protein
MIGRVLRVMLALMGSGLAAELLFIASGQNHYFDMFVVLSPVVAFLSIPIGGLFYVALATFGVSLTVPVCIAAGALVGALPGLILWALPHPGAAQAQLEDFRTFLLIFGAFGATGGLAFSILARMLGVR